MPQTFVVPNPAAYDAVPGGPAVQGETALFLGEEVLLAAGGIDLLPRQRSHQSLCDRFIIERRLGFGDGGVVFLARHACGFRSGELVAIKFHLGDSEERRSYGRSYFLQQDRTRRFLQEGAILANLQHPHIVGFDALMQTRTGMLAIVMEYVKGITFDSYCRSLLKSSGGPDLEYFAEILKVSQQLAQAVSYMHKRGVIHGELKPSNALVEMLGSQPHLKLIDFGFSKRKANRTVGAERKQLSEVLPQNEKYQNRQFTNESATRKLLSCGSVLYAAPEQSLDLQIDERTDVFGFGITLYEALTGRHSFSCGATSEDECVERLLHRPPDAPRSINPEIPEDLETILLQMLAKNPGERLQTMEVFGQKVGEVIFRMENAL